jgi:NAD(P)H dehydrogenase (quinone)
MTFKAQEPTMILVTGASGHFGQRVLHHLLNDLAVPAGRIVAASRTPAKLSPWAAQGVTVRGLDFEDPATFAPAFSGVERALLISTDTLDRPGHRLEQHRRAVAGLAASGVGHVVYTSMPKPEGSPILFAPDHAGTEQALAESSLPGWTVLRNHWYFENHLHSLPSLLATGKWYSAAEGRGSAEIGRDDLARAAATVLAGGETGKQTYTLSGGKALTHADLARGFSAATGRPIEVVPVPLEALVQGMVAAGLPEPMARTWASFDANTAAGRMEELTDDYRRITGREPQTFEAWLAENAEELRKL